MLLQVKKFAQILIKSVPKQLNLNSNSSLIKSHAYKILTDIITQTESRLLQ